MPEMTVTLFGRKWMSLSKKERLWNRSFFASELIDRFRLDRQIDRLAASRNEEQYRFAVRTFEGGLDSFRTVDRLTVDLEDYIAPCDTCFGRSSVRVDRGNDHSFGVAF